MMLSRPCSASTGVRASGASTKRDALRRRAFAHLRRRRRLARRRVDDDQSLARAARDAVGAVDDFLDLRRAGHAQEHDVAAARELGVVATSFAPAASRSSSGLRLRCSAHRERIALGDEVLRDAVAHQPEADEADAWLCSMFMLLLRLIVMADSVARSAGVERAVDQATVERLAAHATRARRRSCSAMSKPAAGDDAMPANVDASGKCRRRASRSASPRRAART